MPNYTVGYGVIEYMITPFFICEIIWKLQSSPFMYRNIAGHQVKLVSYGISNKMYQSSCYKVVYNTKCHTLKCQRNKG